MLLGMAARKKKTTREKMAHPAELIDMPALWEKRYGQGKMLIPAPLDLETLVKKIPRGRVTTLRALGDELAQAAGAVASCPITSGIFLKLVAIAAEEDLAEGKKRVAPWWRVVGPDGKLWPKAPGGLAGHARRLREDGVEIRMVRGTPRVADRF